MKKGVDFMDTYITGSTIKRLRENLRITQQQLAEKIGVSSKTVSKWETAKGLPDISLIEPLSLALQVSVAELLCHHFPPKKQTNTTKSPLKRLKMNIL